MDDEQWQMRLDELHQEVDELYEDWRTVQRQYAAGMVPTVEAYTAFVHIEAWAEEIATTARTLMRQAILICAGDGEHSGK